MIAVAGAWVAWTVATAYFGPPPELVDGLELVDACHAMRQTMPSGLFARAADGSDAQLCTYAATGTTDLDQRACARAAAAASVPGDRRWFAAAAVACDCVEQRLTWPPPPPMFACD